MKRSSEQLNQENLYERKYDSSYKECHHTYIKYYFARFGAYRVIKNLRAIVLNPRTYR